MMEDARNGLINTIVVKDLPRFGRNHVKVGSYLDEVLPNMGVRFIAVGDNADSARTDFDYDLMIPIKNVFNEYYPADCSRKTRQALKAKAANGVYIAARAPYGYRKSKEDKHILEVDEIRSMRGVSSRSSLPRRSGTSVTRCPHRRGQGRGPGCSGRCR